MSDSKSNSENMNTKDSIEQNNVLERIFKKKLIVNKYLEKNDELLEEIESLKYDDSNSKEFFEKCFEFKNNQKQLVEKMNDFREELRKLGITVPPRLVL